MADPKFAGRLLDQFKTLLMATKDKGLSQGDLAVFGEVIDWYRPAKGNAWCTLDHLCTATGSHKSSVMRSLKRLVASDWLKIVSRGRRGRAAVYVPNFARLGSAQATLFGSSTPTHTTGVDGVDAERLGSVGASLSDSLGSVDATLSTELGSVDATPLDIPSATNKVDGRVGRNIDPDAGASPHPAAAPGGAAGVASGFEELWRAYGVKFDRAKAKAVFSRLAPNAELLTAMLTSAEAWRTAYDEQEKAQRWRFRLHNWIDKEMYLEDPPPPYEPTASKRRKAPAKAAPAPVSATSSTVARIVDSVDCVMGDGEEAVVIVFEGNQGEQFERRFGLRSHEAALARLALASGRPNARNTEELHGADVRVTRGGGSWKFDPMGAGTGRAPAGAGAKEQAHA